MNKTNLSLLAEKVIAGQTLAIARAIRLAEEQSEEAAELLDYLHLHQGKALRLGVAGPPGAGKSSFCGQLIKKFRASGWKVGVIAIDPSSPFSGGAILGDRLRMNRFADDPLVFIRSMATRGHGGGLSRAASRTADILDAAGKDVIIFETAGTGQTELNIRTEADIVIVITVPYAGDIIQSMKAGLMEIGDILVVNKADLPGSESTRDDIEFVLEERYVKKERRPQVYLSDAVKGLGFEEIFKAVEDHFRYLKESGDLKNKRLERVREQARFLVEERLLKRFWTAERLDMLSEHGQKPEDKTTLYALARKIIEAKDEIKTRPKKKKAKLCSACLLGTPCRYDGLSKPHPKALSMNAIRPFIPVCPEESGGLATPRPPAEIRGGAGADVLDGKARVVTSEGIDVSDNFIKGAVEVLRTAELYDVKEVVLKRRGPSCGSGQIYDGSFSGKLTEGDGVTAALLKREGIKVLSEDDL